MKNIVFLDAMGQLDNRIILELVSKMDYKETKTHCRTYRGLIALAAALVIVLSLSVAAYAFGWFGLSTRLTPAENPIKREETLQTQEEAASAPTVGFLTMNGAADSNEAKASVEWQELYTQLLELRKDDKNYDWDSWLESLPEHAGEARSYTCFNEEMLDGLLKIGEKYGLRLHTERAVPITQALFYKAAGLERFIPDDNGDFWGMYIFEDGSFKGDGQITLNGRDFSFGLNLSKTGVLAPNGMYVSDAEGYEEWQLEQDGYVLNLALHSNGDRGLILLQDEDCFITINFRVYDAAIPKEEAEHFAESFDYDAICSGEPDLSVISSISGADAAEARPKTGLLTVEDFIKTPEYLAGTDFNHSFGDYVDTNDLHGDAYVKGQYQWCHYAPFPSEVPELDDKLTEIQERYAMKLPTGAQAIMGGVWTNPEFMTGPMSCRLTPGGDVADFKLGPASAEDYWTLVGTGNFLLNEEARLFTAVRWDNGAWYSYVTCGTTGFDLYYVPKGSFCPVLKEFLHPDSGGWAYDTASGEQVFISLDGDMEYPRFPNPVVLYETDNAYVILGFLGTQEAGIMQMFADTVDFSMFN